MENFKPENDKKETGRIEAFSDGVFSIALTLLVLDIHVPQVKSDESLINAILLDWKTYLAFIIGFFTLLVCWINHHYMFEQIIRVNGMLLLLNGFKLLIVSFTPFATALISKYIGTPQQSTALSLYALNFFLMGLAMTCLWLYAVLKSLTRPLPLRVLDAASRLYIFAAVLSGCIFIVSLFSSWASFALFMVMFLVFIFPKNVIRKLTKISSAL